MGEKNFVVMMRGFTAVGKTLVAKKLFHCLKNNCEIDIFHSAVVRKELGLASSKLNYRFDLRDPVFVRVVSPRVYGEIARRAKEGLKQHRNVILDATYNFFWQRNPIYTIAESFDTDFYILRCTCKDEKIIKKRLRIRGDPSSPFNEASAWETYLSTVRYSESIEKDRLPDGRKPKIIEYDTCEETIKTFNIDKNDEMANKIIDCLKKT
jgi:predicted kinase